MSAAVIRRFGLCLMGAVLAVAFAMAQSVRAEVQITPVTSAKGVTAWLVQEHSIPFIALDIRFEGGANLDLPGKRGAVNLMAALLEEGAVDLDARAFSQARETLAASIGFRAGDDTLSVSAQFLTENRDQAADLLHKALSAPRFDEDAIERVRAQVIAGIKADAQDPNTLAARAFGAAAFGDHPYGSSRDGTVDSVQALTRSDLLAAHRNTVARDRVHVGVVGDITPEALGVLLDQILGDLPETGAPLPPRAVYGLTGGITVVPYDTPQSVLVFGHQGLRRDEPDFFAAYVLNEVVGGGRFGARLMQEVRVKRGLTYGISTYLSPMDLAELYMGRVASQNAKVGQVVEVVRQEWAKAAAGITGEELETAKTFLTGAYPLRFDGNANIAAILVGLQMENLPIDYVATRNARIDALTLDDVNRVAARLFRPDQLRFVIVGQPEGLDALQ